MAQKTEIYTFEGRTFEVTTVLEAGFQGEMAHSFICEVVRPPQLRGRIFLCILTKKILLTFPDECAIIGRPRMDAAAGISIIPQSTQFVKRKMRKK